MTIIVLEDGQELPCYWCDDGVIMMALCDADHDRISFRRFGWLDLY